jgi:putative membrane protein
MRVEALLSVSGFAAVEAAIAQAEARTSGEIVFVLAERSDPYRGPRSWTAAALAFAAGVGCLVSPLSPALWLPGLQAAVFLGGYATSAHPTLLRAILRTEWRREAVEHAAGLAFLEQGVAHTRERTGILIYLSLLERQVVVLADRGIAARVDAGAWDEVVDLILSGIRAREAEQGLSRAVLRCGEILARHFPASADNPDELPNPVRQR